MNKYTTKDKYCLTLFERWKFCFSIKGTIMRDKLTKEQLKQIRISKGMTQQQFGEWVGYAKGCAQTRISDIERGAREVPPNVELSLAREYNEVAK